METKSDQQFEITVFTKDKIICKRYFEDYNFKKNEIEFDVAIKIINTVSGMIKAHLKSETINYLWSQYDCNCSKIIKGNNVEDTFVIVVIYFKRKVLVTSCISTMVYPAKIKYSIDIRPIIPEIISKIRKYLKKA